MNSFEQIDLTPEQRRTQILELIKKKKSVSVHQLSKGLYIHEATVRRDLKYLSDCGAISRVHGGAVLTEGMGTEIPLFIRETDNKEVKKILQKLPQLLYATENLFFWIPLLQLHLWCLFWQNGNT